MTAQARTTAAGRPDLDDAPTLILDLGGEFVGIAPGRRTDGPAPDEPSIGASGGGAGLTGVARGGVANLAGAAFAGLAGLAVTWLAARGLGPTAAGAFFAATAAFVLITGVAKLGTPTGAVYWIARLRTAGEPALVGPCLRAALGPMSVAATLFGVALWFAAPWLAGVIHRGPPTAADAATLRALAVFVPLAALTDTLLAASRGYRLMRPTVMVDKMLRPGLQLAGIGGLALLALWTAVPTATWALAWAAPYLPAVLLAGYALSRLIRGGRATPRPAAGQPGRIGREFWRFTGPRAVASVLHLALQRLDVILVAALAGPVPAAIYAVAGRFVVLGQFASQAISNAAQPRLAERLSIGDTAGTNLIYRITTGWVVLATWPLYLLAIGFAPYYLALFGDAYRGGVLIVVVLAAAMLLATGCGMVDMLLAMGGRTSWNLLNVAVALVSMVALDLVLIPRHGAFGAAIGLAVAVAVNNLLPLAQVGLVLRLHPFGAGTLTAAALATACFGVLPTLAGMAFGTGPAAAAGAVIAGSAGYAYGVRRLRRVLGLDHLLATAGRRLRRGATAAGPHHT